MTGDALDSRSGTAPLLRRLLRPSVLLILTGNLLPLAGILLWHWDAFLLLLLYWMETAVIGFWTMARIVLAREGAGLQMVDQSGTAVASRFRQAAFFTLHSGVFMLVHFLFLWAVFSGDWPRRIRGPGDFVRLVLLGAGLWLPLAALFVGQGLAAFRDRLEPAVRRLLSRWFGRPLGPARPTPAGDADLVLLGFYGRIVIMQVTIILGTFVALLLGTTIPFVILIAIKTGVELYLHVRD